MPKEWKGIQMNHCMFQGTITSDPTFSGEYAFLVLRTVNLQRDSNGQFVEVDQEIPLMVEPGSAASKVVKTNIKAGRKLLAWSSFKTWDNNGQTNFAFTVKRIDLGDKPYEGPSQSHPSIPQ